MQKRHLLVAVVMLVASAVSYSLVQMTEASQSIDTAAPARHGMGVTAAASPLVLAVDTVSLASMIDAVPDAAMLFATGATLLAVAAGVRRRS